MPMQVAIMQRLAERSAGIEEQHRRVGVDLRHHFTKQRCLRPERREQREGPANSFSMRRRNIGSLPRWPYRSVSAAARSSSSGLPVGPAMPARKNRIKFLARRETIDC